MPVYAEGSTKMPKFTRILSIDGGGIRGIIPGQVLVSLEEKLKQHTGNSDARIADYFDLVAGSSAGGILTCIYLCPDQKQPNKARFSAQDAVDFYIKRGKEIFDISVFKALSSVNGLIDEKYPFENLEKIFFDYFQDLKLSELLKPCLISSYDIERRKAHFFTQHDAKICRADDYFVRDVARATAAAPTYFEVSKIKSFTEESYALIDGGVFANNPALCAYAEVRHKFQLSQENENGPRAENMVILSLGTGDVKKEYRYEEVKNWGKIQWIVPLLSILMTGVAETVDYQITQIFDAIKRPKNYLRINPTLDKNQQILIDDASDRNIATIRQIGFQEAEKHSEDLDRFIELLLLD